MLALAQMAQRPVLARAQASAREGQNEKDRWADGLGMCHKEPAYSGKSERCRSALTQHHPFDASESPSGDTVLGFLPQAESSQFLHNIMDYDYALSNGWEAVPFG